VIKQLLFILTNKKAEEMHLRFKVWKNWSSKRRRRRGRIITKQNSHKSKTLERHNYQCSKLFKFLHNLVCFPHNQRNFRIICAICLEISAQFLIFFRTLSDGLLFATIQMKATEQYFPVELFIMVYKVVVTFQSVGKILKCDTQLKVNEQCFPVVLFIMVCKVVLTFQSIGKILK